MDKWRYELYGASIVHYPKPIIDQAIGSRTITIGTHHRKGKYKPPMNIEELGNIFRGLGELIHTSDLANIGASRINDIWAPILAVANLAKDMDWMQWANEQVEKAIDDLKDGHSYELSRHILAYTIKALTDEGGCQIVCRQLKVNEDIVEPLRRNERIQISAWQASRQLKDLGFTVERIGGQNKFTPTLDCIKRVAENIGYEDSLLQ